VSRFAGEFARGNGFKVHDSLDQLPYAHYDIVTAIEVLEHCHSPMKVLSAIHRCLKPGGTLYYTTLNFDGFRGRFRVGMRELHNYVVPEGHIHFFSTRVMRSYFGRIGYSDVFHFEPKCYVRGPLYTYLSRLGLTEVGDLPNTFLGRVSYYGAREAATMLGLRKRLLPLARK
jgi:SAM-dependent methyltransferase